MKKDIIKDISLISLGTLSLTKKKVDKVVKGFVKKGVLTKKIGDGLVSKVLAEVNTGRKKIEKIVIGELKKAEPVIRKATGKASREGKRIVLLAKVKAKKAAKKATGKASREGKRVVLLTKVKAKKAAKKVSKRFK